MNARKVHRAVGLAFAPFFLITSLTGVGAGPCAPQLGGMCLDLLSPSVQGSAVVNVMGNASIS